MDGGKAYLYRKSRGHFIGEPMTDNINHPAHYTGKIEMTDYIIEKNLNWCRANVVKYVTRAGIKDAATEVEDLKKAKWYIEREIIRLEGK